MKMTFEGTPAEMAEFLFERVSQGGGAEVTLPSAPEPETNKLEGCDQCQRVGPDREQCGRKNCPHSQINAAAVVGD